MNAIMKAIDDVKYRIPAQILNEVFVKKGNNWKNFTPVSLDERIINLVIKNRVLVDCNLVGGAEVTIPLDGYVVERYDAFSAVYVVPKSATQGRSITSVLSVGYAATSMQGVMGGLGGIRQGTVNAVNMAGMAVMDAASPMPISSTARVQLIAENTILVKDVNPLISNAYVRCIIANDENLNHIQRRSIPVFCKLVELAVKSYVYNTLIITMDSAFLQGGMDLGKFKDIVEGYADSEEMYQEFLRDKWAGVSVMNDRETFTRLIKMQLGASR